MNVFHHSDWSMSLFYPGLTGKLSDWSKGGMYICDFRDWQFVGPKAGLYGLALHEALVERVRSLKEFDGWHVIKHDYGSTVLRLATFNCSVDVDCERYDSPYYMCIRVLRYRIGCPGSGLTRVLDSQYFEDIFDVVVDDVTRGLLCAVASFDG